MFTCFVFNIYYTQQKNFNYASYKHNRKNATVKYETALSWHA